MQFYQSSNERWAGQSGRPASGQPRYSSLGLWLLVSLLFLVCAAAHADDTNSPPMTQQDYFEGGTNTYTDWVTLSAGGLLTKGNQPQAEENLHYAAGAFGGIEDLHLQGSPFTNINLTLDGHSIFDQHNYSVSLKLAHPYLWYLRFHAENFRTWYNDAGGFYPPTGTEYPGSSDALGLDRGEYSVEAGVTPQKLPALTFKYTHRYRDGEKSSTIWAPAHVDLFTDPTLNRAVVPSLYDINEKIDTFELTAKKHIKQTDLGLGLRYQTAKLNNTLYETPYRGEPAQQNVADNQRTSYDLFDVNAHSETWIKNNLLFSSGFLFANLDSDVYGSRVYTPTALAGYGYNNLVGDSHLKEYVVDLNLMSIPLKSVTIIPAVRVNKEYWDANSSALGTLGTFPDEPFSGQSSRDVVDVCESLDVRYTGITNWVFSARGEWDQGQGNLKQYGGFTQVGSVGAVTNENDDGRFFQKYSVNVRWYPLYRLTINAGGYYKDYKYDYSNPVDNTPNDPTSLNRYPGYLSLQDFQTYDGNIRLTLRPIGSVSLVTRYEYQLSTIDTKPEPASGVGELQSSKLTSHIIGEDIGWIPWSRLSLQAGFDYVLSKTETPASGLSQAVLNSQNDYWTLNFSSDFIVDDKTDLNVAYFYYQADDYQDNSTFGLPLGIGGREHAVTATLTRRISQNLRASLKYGYYNYDDATSGGYNNFEAHLIFASIQYRF